MKTAHDNLEKTFQPWLAAVRGEVIEEGRQRAGESRPAPPFITISRQAGAGGRSLANKLVERLNAIDPGEVPWTAWDQELVHKVAEDHCLPEHLVEMLEDERHTWLRTALESLSVQDDPSQPDDFKVYHRVATTIQKLAEMGRVVIVGRGGVHITRRMSGGVHVRLVATLCDRIQRWAKRFNVSPDEASAAVLRTDRTRRAFYERYWPDQPLVPEMFALTLNTSAVPEEKLAECVLPVVPPGVKAAAVPSVPATRG